MTNEQLVIRIQAGDNIAEDMLQLWQQNRGYINKIVKAYIEYGEEDDLQQLFIIVRRKGLLSLPMPAIGLSRRSSGISGKIAL